MEYETLKDGADEVRLLTIISSAEESRDLTQPIRCKLENLSLQQRLPDDATTKLDGDERPSPRYLWGDYIALSYTWGDSTDSTQIVINDESMSIRINLEAGIRQLCNMDFMQPGIKIWADAICINQQDTEERSQEVRRMRSIFANAKFVVAWLGPEENQSNEVFDLMHSVVDTLKGLKHAKLTRAARDIWKGGENDLGMAIFHFANREYWKRLWVIQEISVNEVIVMCGSRQSPWKTLADALKGVHNARHHGFRGWLEAGLESWVTVGSIHNRIRRIIQLGIYRSIYHGRIKNHLEDTSIGMLKLLLASQVSNATDPLDKVYGILGLMDDAVVTRITPNYKSLISDTYCSFVRSVILTTRSLDILSLCEKKYGHYPFPSWTPDLRRDTTAKPLQLLRTAYFAGGDIAPVVEFPDNSSILTCQGITFDFVDGLGAVSKRWHRFYGKNDEFAPERVDRKSSLSAYGDDESSITVFRLTLLTSMKPNTSFPVLLGPIGSSDTNDIYVSEFIEDNKDFEVYGKTVPQYFQQSSLDDPADLVKTAALMTRIWKVLRGRRIMTTRNGYLGIVPACTLQGDTVAILFGCSTPVVLRKFGNLYRVVGECYVHGIMNGEGLDEYLAGNQSRETFVIF